MDPIKQLSDELRDKYLELLKSHKEDYVYKYTVGMGLTSLDNNPDIDSTILDYAEGFFSLYRRTGDEDYFTLGKILRRAAHVLYRENRRKYKKLRSNYKRFLSLVE